MTEQFTAWDDLGVWNDDAIWVDSVDVPALLPHNSTAAELAMEQATARIGAVPVPLRTLWNPQTCPMRLLPWLAWALGIDEWDAAWPDEVKRSVVAGSVEVHRRKGTIGAMRRALHNAGYGDATIIERYGDKFHNGALTFNGSQDHSSPDHWAEYRVIMARPLTNRQAEFVRRILNAVAPLRCHLKVLDFTEVAYSHNGVVRFDGAVNHGAA